MQGSCCFLRLSVPPPCHICCPLMVAKEAEVIVFQLRFLLSYFSVRDHLDSFIHCYHHICEVWGFFSAFNILVGLENCGLLKSRYVCKSCIWANDSIR